VEVIVTNTAVLTNLSSDAVALIFKRKIRISADGQQFRPVNLAASHSLRRVFSTRIFGHNPEELQDYWRDMYFHGVLPPLVLASEEVVIRFVASTPGAIGYVPSVSWTIASAWSCDLARVGMPTVGTVIREACWKG
jgi:ABC-type phosphate transport system substrate-binding protein